jgi:hypothetical protein
MITLILAAALVGAAQKAPPVVSPPPIYRMPQSEQYGDWSVQSLGGTMYMASTGNSSGSKFGEICDADGCLAFFNPQVECEDGHRYPALVNSPSGAVNVVLTCKKIDDLYLLTLPDATTLTDPLSIGGELGIAFPMQSGQFAVSRFSMTGGLRACARAEQLATPAPVAPGGDSRL